MEQIETMFTQLRLHGMNQTWQSLLETRRTTELSLAEGLELMLQAEKQERKNRRTERHLKNARFRYQASLEEIKYDPSRGLDKALVSRLAKGDYITNGESVLITGACGCGKSFLSSALGHHACSQGWKVAYFNTQKLLLKTKIAHIDGTAVKTLEKLAKTDLLIMDDFGLAHLETQQRLDLMEIIEDRHAKKATIIASQLPVASWYDVIGEDTIADAIMDRMVHTSHRIEIKGDNMRKKR
jgi:DNA replication protein DnaC